VVEGECQLNIRDHEPTTLRPACCASVSAQARNTADAQRCWKDAPFDAEESKRFLPLHEESLPAPGGNGGAARRCLARINSASTFLAGIFFRGSARAFAADRASAGGGALTPVTRDTIAKLTGERMFVPTLRAQRVARGPAEGLRATAPLAASRKRDAPRYALRHRDVIRRFGRFPHRNVALGRVSTPEEIEFLKQPGSRF